MIDYNVNCEKCKVKRTNMHHDHGNHWAGERSFWLCDICDEIFKDFYRIGKQKVVAEFLQTSEEYEKILKLEKKLNLAIYNFTYGSNK